MDAEDWSRAESEQIRRDAQADAADQDAWEEQETLLTEFANYLQDTGYQISTERCHRVDGRSAEWVYTQEAVSADELRAVINGFLRDRLLADMQPPTGPEGAG